MSPFRCDLCSLSGDDLKRNENMLKKLSGLDNEAKQLYSFGLRSQSIQKMEQMLELVDENLDQFCTEVTPLETFGTNCLLIFPFQLPLIYFYSALAAFKQGEKEKGMMYRNKALTAAAAISKNYQKLVLELCRSEAGELPDIMENL